MQQTLKIRNGEKVTPSFPVTESQRRLKMLRDHMTGEDLEAVLFTSIHNINYFSDFLYCAFGRAYGLVVTQDKAVTISANIDGGQPFRRSTGDNLVYTDWQKDNYFKAVQNEVGSSKRIGIEFDHISLQNHEKLSTALPGASFFDVGAPTMHMRMIKSDEEIELIRHGAQVADIGGAHCVEAIEENVPEYEVALHATRAMVREIARRFPHGELMDTWH